MKSIFGTLRHGAVLMTCCASLASLLGGCGDGDGVLPAPVSAATAPVAAWAALASADERGKVTKTEIVAAAGNLPAYCKVVGVIAPAINYEVRMPTTAWNGRFLQQGCGGMCGGSPAGYLDTAVDALSRGYAI